jgi:hypothetical protein
MGRWRTLVTALGSLAFAFSNEACWANPNASTRPGSSAQRRKASRALVAVSIVIARIIGEHDDPIAVVRHNNLY